MLVGPYAKTMGRLFFGYGSVLKGDWACALPSHLEYRPWTVGQQAALERQALEQLRRGDLRGAHGTLGLLAQLRPRDDQIHRRLEQVEELIARRSEARERMRAEPLRYAHSYIKAGRLDEGLRLLRAALAKEPNNTRLRDLALQVAQRLRSRADAGDAAPERRTAEAALRSQVEARRKPSSAKQASVRPASEIKPRSMHPSPRAPSAYGDPPPSGDGNGARRALLTLLHQVRTRRRNPSKWLAEPSNLPLETL